MVLRCLIIAGSGSIDVGNENAPRKDLGPREPLNTLIFWRASRLLAGFLQASSPRRKPEVRQTYIPEYLGTTA